MAGLDIERKKAKKKMAHTLLSRLYTLLLTELKEAVITTYCLCYLFVQ